jgi:hypothetical protein
MYNPNAATNNNSGGVDRFLVAAAAALVAQHMNTVEGQNDDMLAQQSMLNQQMWVQNQLLTGRPMDDIQRQLDQEDARAQISWNAQVAADEAAERKHMYFVTIWGLAVVLFLVLSMVLPPTTPQVLFWVVALGIPYGLARFLVTKI